MKEGKTLTITTGKTLTIIAGRGLREASSMASGQERSGP